MQVTTYRIRAGAPQPSVDSQTGSLNFVLQSFGAEQENSLTCQDKTELLESLDMEGQGGMYRSASYQGTNLRTPEGVLAFNATETLIPVFIDETDVPNVGEMFELLYGGSMVFTP